MRFLPEYDNVLLSHDDRSRFRRRLQTTPLLGPLWSTGWGAVLQDGLVRAIWSRRDDELIVRHVPLQKRAQASVAAEGRRLARFLGVASVRLEAVLSSRYGSSVTTSEAWRRSVARLTPVAFRKA